MGFWGELWRGITGRGSEPTRETSAPRSSAAAAAGGRGGRKCPQCGRDAATRLPRKNLQLVASVAAEVVAYEAAHVDSQEWHVRESISQAHGLTVADIADRFGSQCCVASVDARRIGTRWEVFSHGGRNPTGIDAVGHAIRLVELGAGEVLVTSMDRDGTRDGYDLALTRAVADAVRVPVIASGGVGSLDHLVAGVREGGADAVLAASIFHFGEATIADAHAALARAGLPVRGASA